MLRTRVISTLILLPAVVLFVYLGNPLFALLMGVIAALALNEFSNLLIEQGDRPLRVIGGGATALLILYGLGVGETLLPAALALVVFGGLLSDLAYEKDDAYLRGWALTIAGVLYIGFPLGLAVAIRDFQNPDGLVWCILTAVGVWSSDTGAYFAGRFLGGKLFGDRKFSPRWSPNKTWEGFLGGCLLSLIAVYLIGIYVLGLAWWQALLLGAGMGPISAWGDLAESMVKRRVGVKDSGDLIPGHGGMLDRIDSMLFGIVWVFFFAQWMVY
jgi:phosphatidate cytidylyltransferase